MNYKKFLELLEWDYSNEDLRTFLIKKHIDWKRYGIITAKKRQYIKEIYIPMLIQKNQLESEKLAKEFSLSPLMRLAFVRCKQKQMKLNPKNAFYYIATEAIDIVNHIDKDDKEQAIKQRFKEYYNHVKKGHYDHTDDTII